MTAADAASRSYRSSLDIKKSAYRATLSFFLSFSLSQSPPTTVATFFPFFLRFSPPSVYPCATRNRYQEAPARGTTVVGGNRATGFFSLSSKTMDEYSRFRVIDSSSPSPSLYRPELSLHRDEVLGVIEQPRAGVSSRSRCSGRLLREERGQVERFRMTSTRTDTSMRRG